MQNFSLFDRIMLLLVILGALAWGGCGFFGFNAVELLLGQGSAARLVYAIVGLAGIWSITFPFRFKKAQEESGHDE